MKSFIDFISEDKIENIKNMNLDIDIRNLDIYTTKHGQERLTRENNLKGIDVTADELIRDIKTALPAIMTDYANGEINNEAVVLITNTNTKLNIVGTLKVQKGKDFFGIVTVLRTNKFFANDIDKEYRI
jgi:predicted HAD superfamily hydrolase